MGYTSPTILPVRMRGLYAKKRRKMARTNEHFTAEPDFYSLHYFCEEEKNGRIKSRVSFFFIYISFPMLQLPSSFHYSSILSPLSWPSFRPWLAFKRHGRMLPNLSPLSYTCHALPRHIDRWRAGDSLDHLLLKRRSSRAFYLAKELRFAKEEEKESFALSDLIDSY